MISLWVLSETLIQSGKTPTHPSLKLTFTEVARVSPSDRAIQKPWHGATVGLAHSKQGHVYLVDPVGLCILHFDEKGTLKGAVGRQGQGPGEYSALIGFSVLTDGRLMAVDNRASNLALMTYDPNDRYLDQKLLATGNRTFQSAVPDPSGTYLQALSIAVEKGRAKGQLFLETSLLKASDLSTTLLVSRVPEVAFDPNQLMSASYWSTYLAELFSMTQQGLGLCAFQTNGNVLAAKTDAYKISQYTTSGKRLRTMQRQYTPVPMGSAEVTALSAPVFSEVVDTMPPQVRQLITQKVIDQAIQLAKLPPVKPPVLGIIPFVDDRFLVIRNSNDKATKADLFGDDGIFQAEVVLPPLPVHLFGAVFGTPRTLLFHGNKAYALVRTADDELDLVYYTWELAD